ncbi:MAG: hypothetical protein CL678_08100 [Bdellovibrionaceae bacterium]|nr:hypothetical protein [Pseudobdellovibrionaceae bacterium]|tara:strand:+ start:1491 stop:4634 length:3144 start_codon:yes stop_codon:yes gene_type:complete
MEKLVVFFLKNNKLTVMLSVLVAVGGYLGMVGLNSESFPQVNLATAIIETDYPGAAPEDVEIKVTKPIEDEIRKVQGLKDVRSISQSGKSKIIVRVDMDHYDVEVVMSDLERAIEKVTQLPADLPEDPKFTEIKSDEFPAIELAVLGDNTNRARDLIADQLADDLEDSRRVKGVILSGYTEREFTVLLDQQKLDQFHIGVNEVLRKIRSRNLDIPGGDLVRGVEQQLVRIKAKVRTSKELSDLVIRSNFSGRKVTLKDVATVEDSHEEPRFLSKYNGKDATILIVNKKGGADTIELVTEVQSVIDRYQSIYKDQFPIIIFNNEANKVKNRLEILGSNAFSGLILVVVFLLIFLPGWIGIMASFSLPLAVLATFGLMPSFGMNLDAITILALVIALGMLVDNSVVISENFTRLRLTGKSSFDAAVESVKTLALPITATAMTTIGAFLPMLVTQGIMGEFIKFIPIVVTIALVISLIESFFLLPLRLQYAGDHTRGAETSSGHNDWFQKIIDRFQGVMSYLVDRRYRVALGFTGLLIFSFVMMGVFNQFILFPAEQTEVYLARFEAPIGTTLERSHELSGILSQKVADVLGNDVKAIVAKAGTSLEQPNDPRGKEGNNVGMLVIYVTDEAKFDLDYRVALEKLRKIKMSEFDRLEFSERINGPPVGSAINATFRSNNMNSLQTMVEKIQRELSLVDGIFDLKTDEVIGDDEVFVEINYAKVDRLGLSVSEIGETVRTALSGTRASDVTLNNKEVYIRVQMKEKDRQTITDLNELKVMDLAGNLVPLNQLATFRRERGTPQVKRFDFKRAVTLTGSVNEKKITSQLANRNLKEIYQRLSVDHSDVSLVFGGQAESTKESMESLGKAMVLALLAIFALMVFVFNSYMKPMIVMSTIPLGLVGFSIAFFLHGRPVSFLAMIGLVGLAGIIVNSGIVLISFIEQMREEGQMELREILIQASGMRLRAVVVTSLTTVSGLLPTAYGIGGSDSILVPMTLAMAWGLTSGTILTLLWVPCAYAILEDLTMTWNKFRGKKKIKSRAVFSNGASVSHK